jgi:hypothetical protein
MQPRLGVPLPKIEDQYQSLHNLVSTAAYLSICTKLSPTIFTFNDVMPGTHWDDKDYYSLENELYAESQEAVLTDYRVRYAAWKERQAKLREELDELENVGKGEGRAGDRARAALMEHDSEEPSGTQYDYRAMCKIGVWPVITRYKPGSDDDDEKGECSRFVREKDGFRILQLAKGAMVLYYGWDRKGTNGMLEPNPAGEKLGLRPWIRGKADTKGLGEKGKVVAGLGAAVLGVMMVGGYGMLVDNFPALQGMEFVEAAKYLACTAIGVCHY